MMMKEFKATFLLLVFSLLCQTSLLAQQGGWVIAVNEAGIDAPIVEEYFYSDNDPSNVDGYNRIHERIFAADAYTTVETAIPFGFKMIDGCIYIYNYDSKTARLAFDFSLKAGEEFTTVNGERWIITEVIDSMMTVKDHRSGATSSQSYKVQKVRNVNTMQTDLWVEGVGSLTNHFMIKSRRVAERCHLLWQHVPHVDSFFAREFSADPFFGHESVMMTGQELNYEEKKEFQPSIACSYNNGEAFIKRTLLTYASYGYHLWYRTGDIVQEVWNWRFGPNSDCPEIVVTDAFTCSGLPRPTSGSYTFRDAWGVESTTDVSSPTTPQPQWPRYDLQGRPISQPQPRQMYIEGGKKVVNGR